MKNMKKVTEILGLKEKETAQVVDKLNELLANYQVYYQNLRGFHWNIKGATFFELHAKFEELYDDAVEKIDEIAERILTVGGAPLHTFEDYLATSTVKPAKNLTDAETTVSTTLDNIAVLIKLERQAIPLAQAAEDEGTLTILTEYISEQEKLVWMLRAYMK